MEYVVAARAVETYEALAAAVQDRHLSVTQADTRHLTLTFRPAGLEGSEDAAVLCAVLDAGHGLSKLVLAGAREDDENVVALLADIDRRLGGKAANTGRGALAR